MREETLREFLHNLCRAGALERVGDLAQRVCAGERVVSLRQPERACEEREQVPLECLGDALGQRTTGGEQRGERRRLEAMLGARR